jgi:cell division protein FtsB
MTFLRRGPFERRGAVSLMFGLFVALTLVLIFSGTLTRSTDIEAEAQKARAEVAELEARFEAGNAEVEFLETDEFVEQFARSISMGERGEKPFALEPGAPSPKPIIPLGSEASGSVAKAPFEAWMELLFGA